MVLVEAHADIAIVQLNASKAEATVQWRDVVAHLAIVGFHLVPPEFNRHRVERDRLDVVQATVAWSANETMLVDDWRCIPTFTIFMLGFFLLCFTIIAAHGDSHFAINPFLVGERRRPTLVIWFHLGTTCDANLDLIA